MGLQENWFSCILLPSNILVFLSKMEISSLSLPASIKRSCMGFLKFMISIIERRGEEGRGRRGIGKVAARSLTLGVHGAWVS